jgi:hypothetical protein
MQTMLSSDGLYCKLCKVCRLEQVILLFNNVIFVLVMPTLFTFSNGSGTAVEHTTNPI